MSELETQQVDETQPAPPEHDVDERQDDEPTSTPDEGDERQDDERQDDDDDELGDEQRRQQQQATRATAEQDIERALRSLEREAIRHAKRVAEIMGDDVGNLVPCELCWDHAPGFRFDQVPPDEVREAVKRAIGMGDLTRYQPAPDAAVCTTCNGEGRVLSGSNVEGQRLIKCLSCDTRGWTTTSPQRLALITPGRAPVTQGETATLELVDGNTAPPPPPDIDPWGTPRDDPEWGILPNLRSPEGQQRLAEYRAAAV